MNKKDIEKEEMGMMRAMSFTIVAMAAFASHFHSTASQTTHIVGDSLGWQYQAPPSQPFIYTDWAAKHSFRVGDSLVFKFITGLQDVARVSKEAYESCNSTNPISLKIVTPAYFTLDTIGRFYFISTVELSCRLGLKLSIQVSAPGPALSPSPSRGPVTYTVGDAMGWLVPPGGAIAYANWALNKVFMIGDILEFNFENGEQDVAVVTKNDYETCDRSNSDRVYAVSQVRIILNETGAQYFTSSFYGHCSLGQKLFINVVADASDSDSEPPPSTSGPPTPPPEAADGPTAPEPVSSAPSTMHGALFMAFFTIAMSQFVSK